MKLFFLFLLTSWFSRGYGAHDDLLERLVKVPHQFTLNNELQKLNVKIELLPAQSEQMVRGCFEKDVSIAQILKIIEALCEPLNPVAQNCPEGYKMLLAEVFLRYQQKRIVSQVNQLFIT